MKKLQKRTFRILIISILLLIALYNFLLSDYNGMFKDVGFMELTKSIRIAKNENLEPILKVYNKIYNDKSQIKKRNCPCENASNYIGPYRHGFSITKKIYKLKIEKEFNEEECLKFDFLNADYLYGNIGIKQASKYYFNKEIEKLNEKEIINLILMLENPSLHNPKRERNITKTKIEFFQRYINRKNGS
jgi:hypothetical protein